MGGRESIAYTSVLPGSPETTPFDGQQRLLQVFIVNKEEEKKVMAEQEGKEQVVGDKEEEEKEKVEEEKEVEVKEEIF